MEEIIDDVLIYIQKNILSDLKVEDLASHFGIVNFTLAGNLKELLESDLMIILRL